MTFKSRFIEMFGTLDLSIQKPEWKEIGSLGTILTGSTPKTNNQEFWDGNIKWITPAELGPDTFVINDTERKITEAGRKSCSLNILKPGTVLLTSRAPIGKVAIAGTEMYCNQGFKNIYCGPEINNIYLYTLLKHNAEYLNSLGRGATFKEVSAKIVSNIKIPAPPRKQQDLFEDFVKQVDKSKAICKQIFQSFDNLVKSRFIEMFGTCKSKVTIENSCSLHARIGWQALTKKEHMETGEYMLITGTDFQNGLINYSTCKYVSKERYDMDPNIQIRNDDILVTKDGSIGKVAIVKNLNNPATLNAGVFVVRPIIDDILPEFLIHCLKSDSFDLFINRVKRGATISHLNQGIFFKFEIPRPSKDAQIEFIEFIKQVDKSKFV